MRMTAGEICQRAVACAYRGLSLSEAARVMRERHVGCLVVVEQTEAGRMVVGMLTDRDIVVGAVAEDRDARQLSVGEAMSRDVVAAREGDTLADLLALMRRRGVRRLPVTDARGMLVGLIALDDVLPLLADALRELAAALEGGRARERATRP